MHKIRNWSQFLRDMLKLIGQMMVLAWRALPFCFVLLLGLELLQGGIPLASAWLSKGIFDALGQGLHGQPFAHHPDTSFCHRPDHLPSQQLCFQ